MRKINQTSQFSLLRLINLCFAAFILLINIACTSNAPANNAQLSPTPEPPDFTVRSVKALEAAAIEKARAWRSDAVLKDISMTSARIDKPDAVPIKDYVWFTFASKAYPNERFELTFKQDGAIQSQDLTWSYQEARPIPIAPSDWTIDSTEAWELALKYGGAEFLRKNKTFYTNGSLSLGRPKPHCESLCWYIYYYPTRGNSLFSIYIDAKSGQLVEKKER